MKQLFYLLLLIIVALGLPFIFNISNLTMFEGYSNYSLDQSTGKFPDAQTEVLVQNTYPAIGKNQLSDNGSNDIWWHYPVFKLGSYAQITNNIRHPDTPDEGTCMPASMCGALYYDKKTGDNYIKQTPPPSVNGTRVGYFTTDDQLIDSLPFGPNLEYSI
jgi:hypothetical protein